MNSSEQAIIQKLLVSRGVSTASGFALYQQQMYRDPRVVLDRLAQRDINRTAARVPLTSPIFPKKVPGRWPPAEGSASFLGCVE